MKPLYSIRYLPNKLTKKDKIRQARMLNKSRKMYKKGKYYTRKQIPSFKNKKFSRKSRMFTSIRRTCSTGT